MRCLVKQGEEWQTEQPEDLVKWLMHHDGEPALVIDDKRPKTYYAGSVELFDQCKAEGKRTFMFYDLSKALFEKEDKPTNPTSNPFYCSTYSLICGDKADCADDCYYKGQGGQNSP